MVGSDLILERVENEMIEPHFAAYSQHSEEWPGKDMRADSEYAD